VKQPNFGSAFDLSTLKKPAATAHSDAPPGVEATVETLPNELMPLSNTKPVIVLCWSERFPESRETLSLMGKFNKDDNESWQLATVEIEKQPQVAQALQTRVVPYAIAIVKEQVMPLFENPYPESQLRLVIDKVLSIASEQGIGEAPIERTEPEEDEAMVLLQNGDLAGAIAAYEKLVARKPGDAMAKSALAQMQLMQRTHGADTKSVYDEAAADPLNVEKQIACADLEVANGKVEDAFARLLNCIRNLQDEDKKRAKDHLITLFGLIDKAYPRLIQSRKDLSSALF
jgi:putative thioredoxin